ncbi:MAG: hypothetical protein ABF285_07735 [Pacificibacter sp.]|uniref:hypothetical protein n=1 Tax=Pacificibacter sp. TaxID=1917866 RepID=UPI00321A2F7D
MLRHVLRANAASCGVFGAIFACFATGASAFIGDPPVVVLQVLGVGLLVNAVALVWTSLRTKPERLLILAFAVGDMVWVLATLVLLIGGIWILTLSGIVWAICVAIFVGACGALQWKLAPHKQ